MTALMIACLGPPPPPPPPPGMVTKPVDDHQWAIVKTLVQAGARAELKNAKGDTARDIALADGNVKLADALSENLFAPRVH